MPFSEKSVTELTFGAICLNFATHQTNVHIQELVCLKNMLSWNANKKGKVSMPVQPVS